VAHLERGRPGHLEFLHRRQTRFVADLHFLRRPRPATISGINNWVNVAFLVGPGTHTLSWVYSQNSQTTTSAGFVAGLQVLSPDSRHQYSKLHGTNAAQFAAVPPSNVDLAITNVTATTGSFLLDDAGGTGVLPVSITVTNVGAPFAASPFANCL
jgi:hypothetical protein